MRTLQDAVKYTTAVIESGVETTNAKALVKMRNALKELEDVAEEARKQVIEPALDDQIEVGESVVNVHRVAAERPTVTDTTTAMQMLEDAGVDPAEVITISPRQFIDAVEGTDSNPSVVIEHDEYTYYRRNE